MGKNKCIIIKISCLIIPVLFICFFFPGCSKKQHLTEKEKTIIWLTNHPPFSLRFWVPKNTTYKSHEEWIAAGKKIEGIERILLDLYDDYDKYSYAIIYALGEFGDSNSTPLLTKVMLDPNEYFGDRLMAIEAERKIRDTNAIEPLCRMALNAEVQGSTDETYLLKANSISTIALIGDPNLLPFLEKAIEELDTDDLHKQGLKAFVKENLGKPEEVQQQLFEDYQKRFLKKFGGSVK